MKTTTRLKTICAVLLISILTMLANRAHAAPVATSFTYQGALLSGGGAANGNFDLTFALFNDPVAGAQIGTTWTNLNVAVSNGLFTTTVDFGPGVFDGTAYWLSIGVRSNGVAVVFATLSPRQSVTPSPYALYATAAAIADGAVTSAKILDGAVSLNDLAANSVNSSKIVDLSIATADLADGSVTSAKILDGTIATVDLGNNSVTSAKIVDGTILGVDVAPNAIGSIQLADDIDLGTNGIAGRLDVYTTSAGTPGVSLIGSSSQISTFGGDGLEQIRLWGASYGEILLYDSSTNNLNVVTLSANGTGGGYLNLRQGGSTFQGLLGYGDNLGGGRLLTYNSSNTLSMDLRAQFNTLTPAAWAGFYDQGSERVSIAARNGTSGQGGLIDVKNDSAANTLRFIGDAGAGRGSVQMYNSGTLVGTLEGHSGGSWLRTFDETGALAATIGTSAGVGGFCELNNSTGAVGLRLDGDDAGGGLITLRNAAGAITVTIDGDFAGDGRVITQELQITGGSDLSEQFDVNAPDEAEPEAGMVVCIDPQHPGQLMPSGKPYDRTVAGVISGAGGVKPGMLMGQRGTAADGKHPVALTGRVYVQADASNGAIQPGDMLTTSNVAGHAMKVTDHVRAQGAILGKAMSSLKEGKGTVLVLVSLQ